MDRLAKARLDYQAMVTAQSVALATSMIYLPLVAKILGPAQFGLVSMVLVAGQVLAAFGFLWANTGTLSIAQTEFHRTQTMGAALWARVLLGAAGLLVLLGGIGWSGWPFRALGIRFEVWIWLVPVLGAWLLSDVALYALRAAGRLGPMAWVAIGRQATLVTGAILLALGVLPRTPVAVVALEGAAFLAMALWALRFVPRGAWRASEPMAPALRHMGIVAAPLLGLQLSGYLTNGVDLYVIGRHLSHEAAGTYQLAYRLMQIIANGAMGVMPVLFHVLMSLQLEDRQASIARYLHRVVPQITVGWGMLMIAISWAASAAFPFVFAGSYAGVMTVYHWLVVGLTAQILMVLYSDLLMIRGRLWPMCLVHAAGLGVNAVGDWWLVPRHGAVGAAWASSARLMVCALGYWFLVARPSGAPAGRVFLPLGAAALTCAALARVSSPAAGALVGAAGIAALALLSRCLALFAPSDWSLLTSLRLPRWSERILRTLCGSVSCRSV